MPRGMVCDCECLPGVAESINQETVLKWKSRVVAKENRPELEKGKASVKSKCVQKGKLVVTSSHAEGRYL